MIYLLWVLQALLALLFLFAGVSKFLMPLDQMVAQTGLPGWLLLFVGVCEILGGLGLVLPGIFRVRTGLTLLAALGLVVIMIGAVTLTVKSMGVGPAIFPFITGLLLLFVAYGRSRLRPLANR